MHTTAQERGYIIIGQSALSVAQSAVTLAVNNRTVYLHNTSGNTIYMDTANTVGSTKWEIPANYMAGPFSADGNLYFISTSGTNTLKVLFVSLIV